MEKRENYVTQTRDKSNTKKIIKPKGFKQRALALCYIFYTNP